MKGLYEYLGEDLVRETFNETGMSVKLHDFRFNA